MTTKYDWADKAAAALLALLGEPDHIGEAISDRLQRAWCSECKAWVEYSGMTYPSGDFMESCRECGSLVDEHGELDATALAAGLRKFEEVDHPRRPPPPVLWHHREPEVDELA